MTTKPDKLRPLRIEEITLAQMTCKLAIFSDPNIMHLTVEDAMRVVIHSDVLFYN